MKKLFNSIFVIIAAMVAFVGCLKEEVSSPETKTVHFIAESIETKTAFGTPDGTTYPTLWTENDTKVEISLNLKKSNSCTIVPSDDFKTATIDVDLEDDQTGSYVFYSVSPASANKNFSSDYKTYNLEIPTTQTPSTTSVDENAQILVAKSQMYSVFPEIVNLAYEHLTAYGKMSLTNLNLNGATIYSVALTASKNFAYRYYYNPETSELEENSSTKTITINTSSATDIWFACAPVDMSNATMDVVVNTDKGTFTKTVTFPEGRKFESGKIAKFAVNMSGVNIVAPEVYELVTEPVIALTPESKVIIVGGEFAMSTNQKANNRGAAGVTISENTISSPSVDVQIFTVEEGVVPGTIALNSGSGYLYAASSSSNHLKTGEKNENASWKVTYAGGKTSVVAQGDNTRNVMQFNPNNGSPMFSCYASESQQPVSIYKLKGSGTVLENYLNVSLASISVDADETTATFSVYSDLDWTVTLSAGATVTKDGNNLIVSFAANTEESEKTYFVTVSADGVESKTVTITQAKKITKTKLTVAEFQQLKDSDALYELTGEITGIYQAYSSQYGNISFYLKDETGEISIYRMSCEGIDHTKIVEGNIITVKGKKTTYNSAAQMAQGGICLSIVEVTPSPVISFAENVVTIKAVEGADIYYTIDGTEPTICDENLYDEPYEIEESCTIKAIAVEANKRQSPIVSQDCFYVDPNAGVVVAVVTVDLTEQGYSNGTEVSTVTSEDVTINFDKGTNSNTPKYYTTGNAVRVYGGGYFTVSAGSNVTKVVLTCGSGDGSNAITTDVGEFNNNTWQGKAESVKFSIGGSSGHRRFAKIEVTYEK